jgi:hypothetical protein
VYSFVKFHEQNRTQSGLNQEDYETAQKNTVRKYEKPRDQLLRRIERVERRGGTHPE